MSERRRSRLTIPSAPGRIREARAWVRRLVREAGWGEDDAADLALAVGEACANCHRYGYRGSDVGRVELRLDLDRERVRIVVRDWGEGFDPEACRRPDPADPGEGGYGLLLMGRLTDRMVCAPSARGTTVVMEKTRRREPGREGPPSPSERGKSNRHAR